MSTAEPARAATGETRAGVHGVAAPPTPAPSPELVRDLAERAGRPDFSKLEAQLRSSGYCARPVRLRGHVETCGRDGRARRVWSTDAEPDGVLRKACGNRREAVCPPCAERYRQDAYHLIAAGLRGGKGVPDNVAGHPLVFVTLTAPSFGAVHTRATGPDGQPRRCRPRHDASTCPHGVSLSCAAVHADGDPCLGEPLCPECFDYDGALLWNNLLGELWRRTTIYLPRALARLLGITQKQLRRLVRVSYVKVAEYQRRGLVHLHVVIRLDRAMPAYRATDVRPPSERFTLELLEEGVRAAASAVTAPAPEEAGGGFLRWGDELEVLHITGDRGIEPGRCAGYLAKYATKATEQAGGVLHRVTQHEVDALPVRAHVHSYLRRAFALGEDAALADRRLGRYAHAFGYRGHCLTKSRRYSTTFKALREARERHVHKQLLARSRDPAQRALAATAPEDRIAFFTYAGRGHLTTADAFLAASAAARARERRRIAWEERCFRRLDGNRRRVPETRGHDLELVTGGRADE